jgi:iron complex outermembrane receptor protein
MFAVRGTVSTGFRAPTLAEEFYEGVNVSPTSAFVSLPPNSPASLLAGFGPLKPEKSTDFSVGFVAHPVEHMQVTLDVYDIALKNRVVETGSIYGAFPGFAANLFPPGVNAAIAKLGVTLDTGISYTGIQLFTNGADTRTIGVDLTANYATDFDEWGRVDWTVGFNYNNTKVTRVSSLPAAVSTATTGPIASLGQFGPILNAVALSALVDSTPQEKAILQALWTKGRLSVNLRGDIYGPESLVVNSAAGGFFTEKIATTGIVDIDVGYKITDSIKLDVGANNLFNTIPPLTPLVGGTTPVDGALVYHVPYTFAPWGSNGGYYYGRLTVSF